MSSRYRDKKIQGMRGRSVLPEGRITGERISKTWGPDSRLLSYVKDPLDFRPVNIPPGIYYRLANNPNWLVNDYVKDADGVKKRVEGFDTDERYLLRAALKNIQEQPKSPTKDRAKSQIGKTFPPPPQRSGGTRSTQATRNLPNRQGLLEDAFRKVQSTGGFLPQRDEDTLPIASDDIWNQSLLYFDPILLKKRWDYD